MQAGMGLDVIASLMSMVNLKGAMIGVAAAQAWNYFVPTTADNKFMTIGGHWMARLSPAVAPTAAMFATIMLEWNEVFLADDAARGILSGLMSEFALRVWYKTLRGV